MPRPLAIALIAIFCLAFTVRADEPDPTKLPVVKKVLDKAEAEVRKHRKAYDDANAKTFEDAEKALKEEVEKLSKAGKPEEAVAVKKLLGSLRDRVVAKAEKSAPGLNPAQRGAVAWNGHKYKFVEDNCSWEDAKKRCEEMGGNLVIIDNDAEQDFVVRSLYALQSPPKTVWLGVTRGQRSGEWVTVQGQKVAFTKWMAGQPDNNRGEDDCVEFCLEAEYKWNDRPNRWPAPFICEWDE